MELREGIPEISAQEARLLLGRRPNGVTFPSQQLADFTPAQALASQSAQ
jgi:hypothetical protein